MTTITDKMIRLKEILRPFRKPKIQYTCCALSGLIILIFIYRPLLAKLNDASNRLRESQTELLNKRNTIALLENTDVKRKVMRQNEVSLVIAELTEKGRDLGLNFSSILPGRLQETTQDNIMKLPISFTIESEYKDTGQFLACVERFSHSVTEVESLSLRLRENNTPNLSVELVLNLYLEIENAT